MFLVAVATVVKHLECSFMDTVRCKGTSLMTHFDEYKFSGSKDTAYHS